MPLLYIPLGLSLMPIWPELLAQPRCLMQVHVWLHDWTPRSIGLWALGMAMWGIGAASNLQCDYLLMHLRRKHGPGCHLATEGLFELVTSANLSSELFEWLGYAIACQSLGAFAFAWFAFCNLAPRALASHEQCCAQFGLQMPRHRRALIPYVL